MPDQKPKRTNPRHFKWFMAYDVGDWIEICDLIPLRSFKAKREFWKFYQELQALTTKKGIIMAVNNHNYKMIRLLFHEGFVPYDVSEDGTFISFFKELHNEKDNSQAD